MELKFECPTCGQHLSATPAQIRPHRTVSTLQYCNHPFSARQYDEQTVFHLPTKLSFLKISPANNPRAKVTELVSLGPIDESIEAKLQDFAVALRLEIADATAVLTGRFTAGI